MNEYKSNFLASQTVLANCESAKCNCLSVYGRLAATLILLATAVFTTTSSAAPVMFTQEFPGGFNVSVNGGPLSPSGPITIRGIVDTTTTDINGDPQYGEFPLISATLTGAGFVNRTVTTPLSLVTFNVFGPQMFGFQLSGQFNQGITGWNGSTSSGNFMADLNDLSTLFALPYATTGSSTFWYDGLGAKAWTLDLGGDTIGADQGANGPDGTFSISTVPEPSSLVVSAFGFMSFATWRLTLRKR